MPKIRFFGPQGKAKIINKADVERVDFPQGPQAIGWFGILPYPKVRVFNLRHK